MSDCLDTSAQMTRSKAQTCVAGAVGDMSTPVQQKWIKTRNCFFFTYFAERIVSPRGTNILLRFAKKWWRGKVCQKCFKEFF